MRGSFRRKEALNYHRLGRPGKMEVVPTKSLTTQRDLALAYSPGVAEPCLEIAKDPDTAFEYTARGNLVAVITNGTAVLGLGDIGPLASKPVMEGKGVLFKKFADIDVFDLELDASDPDRFIECVAALEPTFGGINLEDIKAPECFYIEDELKKRMNIPVFHDDQHGTAIISGAGLLNAAELQGKALADLSVVVSGAGAAAVACVDFYCSLGVARSNVIVCDSHGVIFEGRTERMNELKERLAVATDKRTLQEAMVGADMLLGLSVGGLVTKEMVASMADKPIVFALANPDPEISYEDAKEARPDAIVATGRSDYNNQVNNVLGFPFIFRGALDVRAKNINEEMKVAAARALAELAKREVPPAVVHAYGEDFSFGPEYIIPKPLDPRVLLSVSPAVAEAAIESGVARRQLDMDAYQEDLRVRIRPATAMMRKFVRKASASPQRLVFTEGEDARVLQACAVLVDENIAKPVLLGNPDRIAATVEAEDISLDLSQVELIYPRRHERFEEFVDLFFRRRQRRGIDRELARQRMLEGRYFGTMLVAQGHGDGLVTGMTTSYGEAIRPALQLIGRAEGASRIAAMHVIVHKRGLIFFADTSVSVELDAQGLADVGEMVADAARSFDVEPRIAMVSYSNFGNVRHDEARASSAAVELLRGRRPDLEVEGEMQVNVALDYGMQKRVFPFTRLSGPANVLVFPNLSAGNAAFKLMRELGEVPAVGPVLLGVDRPVAALERECPVDTIVHMAALTAVQAQHARSRPQQMKL